MASINDVAKLSGVSIATVSKCLNGIPVREQNKRKIEKAVNELGYSANHLARSFRTKETKTIGILADSFNGIFTMTIINEIGAYLQKSGYSFILTCSLNYENERKQLDYLMQRYVDGIIMFPVSYHKSEMPEKIAKAVPVVCIDHIMKGHNYSAVVVDNINSSYHATEQLIKNGHTKIGIISGHVDTSTSIERIEGYKRALKDYRLPVNYDYIQIGEFTVESGYNLTKKLLTMSEKPTALFILSSDLWVGVFKAIDELNINIPDDISLITFDYFEYIDLIKPKITLIKQPYLEMGTKAAQVVLDLINNPEKKHDLINYVRLKTEFVNRDSVKNISIKNDSN